MVNEGVTRDMRMYLDARPGFPLDRSIENYTHSLHAKGIMWIGAYEVKSEGDLFLSMCHLVNPHFTQRDEYEVATQLLMLQSAATGLIDMRMKVYNGITPYGVKRYFSEEVQKLGSGVRIRTVFERQLNE